MVQTSSQATYQRLNIYLDSPEMRERIKVAAARSGVTLSDYCLEAIRRRLTEEGFLPPTRTKARAAAKALDRLRSRLDPLGVPVRDLIDEGRRR